MLSPREPTLREPALLGVVFEKIFRPAFAATATGKTNPKYSAIFQSLDDSEHSEYSSHPPQIVKAALIVEVMIRGTKIRLALETAGVEFIDEKWWWPRRPIAKAAAEKGLGAAVHD